MVTSTLEVQMIYSESSLEEKTPSRPSSMTMTFSRQALEVQVITSISSPHLTSTTVFGRRGTPSLFNDDFGSGFSSSFSSFSNGGAPMSGTSKSVSKSTVIRDGKKVTKVTTTTRDASGRTDTKVEEIIEDMRTGEKVHKIDGGNSSASSRLLRD